MLDVRTRRRLDGFELDVAFQADEGRVVLFGPSGAGKSLTLQAITGVMRPDSGRVEVNGRLLFDSASGVNLPPQVRRVGYVPQSYALFPHLTVEQNVAYGVQRLDATQRRALVQETVELVGLQGLERRRPRELSGGQQQRVALARALASRPELLVLDEPFSNIDTGLRGTLRRELLDLQARSGITTLVVTHDLDDAFFLGSRIVVIDRGRVLQAGSREDIFYRPATRRVAEFVGTRNILRATVLESSSERLLLDWQGRTLEAEPTVSEPGARGGGLHPPDAGDDRATGPASPPAAAGEPLLRHHRPGGVAGRGLRPALSPGGQRAPPATWRSSCRTTSTYASAWTARRKPPSPSTAPRCTSSPRRSS